MIVLIVWIHRIVLPVIVFHVYVVIYYLYDYIGKGWINKDKNHISADTIVMAGHDDIC